MNKKRSKMEDAMKGKLSKLRDKFAPPEERKRLELESVAKLSGQVGGNLMRGKPALDGVSSLDLFRVMALTAVNLLIDGNPETAEGKAMQEKANDLASHLRASDAEPAPVCECCHGDGFVMEEPGGDPEHTPPMVEWKQIPCQWCQPPSGLRFVVTCELDGQKRYLEKGFHLLDRVTYVWNPDRSKAMEMTSVGMESGWVPATKELLEAMTQEMRDESGDASIGWELA